MFFNSVAMDMAITQSVVIKVVTLKACFVVLPWILQFHGQLLPLIYQDPFCSVTMVTTSVYYVIVLPWLPKVSVMSWLPQVSIMLNDSLCKIFPLVSTYYAIAYIGFYVTYSV